jgi:hypothetical protein
MHVVDLAVPGFIAALSAWIAVWLTNKNNRGLNETNHEYELLKWDRQTRWTAKRERYETLTADLCNLSSLLLRFQAAKAGGPNKGDELERMTEHAAVLTRTAKVTKLFAGAEVSKAYRETTQAFAMALGGIVKDPAGKESKETAKAFSDAQEAFIAAARKDLGYVD